MGLKECREKFGSAITDEQDAALDTALASGKTDEQAVRIAMLIAHKNVVDIAGRVKEETGVDLKVPANPVSDLAEFQAAALEKVNTERRDLADQYTNVQGELGDIETVRDTVGGDTDKEVLTNLSSLLFQNKDGLKSGVMGLKGSTPLELKDSYDKLLLREIELIAELAEIGNQQGKLNLRVNRIFSGSGDQTLYQSSLGLTSGLLTAAQVMPFTKTMKNGVEVGTDAQQVIATLKKQPNVKKEELEWVAVEEWALAMGKVTQQQLVEFIAAGGVQIKETQYGGDRYKDPVLQFDVDENATQLLRDEGDLGTTVYGVASANYGDTFEVHYDNNFGTVSVLVDNEGYIKEDGTLGTRETYLDIPGSVGEQTLEDAQLAIENWTEDRYTGQYQGTAKWTQFTLPGGKNDREIVMHLPEVRNPDLTLDSLVEQEDLGQHGGEMGLTSLFHLIDHFGPPTMQIDGTLQQRRIQTYQISRQDYPTLEEAKDYIVNHKDTGLVTGANYTSHAYDEKNIIVWFRINDRIGPNGENIMFIEEFQSDLHSAGREQGYAEDDKNQVKAIEKRDKARVLETEAKAKAHDVVVKLVELYIDPAFKKDGPTSQLDGRRLEGSTDWLGVESTILGRSDWHQKLDSDLPPGIKLGDHLTSDDIALLADWRLRALELSHASRAIGSFPNRVPDTPFKGNAWAELAMKRAIRLAAEGGYDQIAWTTGQQQSERYSLGQVVDEISWDSQYNDEDGARRIEFEGETGSEVIEVNAQGYVEVISSSAPQEWFQKHLKELVGVEASEQIMAEDTGTMGFGEGALMEFGGEGMANFYDKVLVNVANKVVKKLDKSAKVQRFGAEVVVGATEFDKGNLQRWKTKANNFWQLMEDHAAAGNTHLVKQFKTKFDLAVDEVKRIEASFDASLPAHKLTLTPQLKQMALEGQTYFQSAPDQTATPEFKKWFKESKAVDKDGKPVQVYHGTQFEEAFEEFDPQGSFGGWNHVGTWFSSEPKHAEIMANTSPFAESGAETSQIIPAYVSIQDPLEGTWDEMVEVMQGIVEKEGIDQFHKDAGKVFKAELQRLGFDGIIIRDWEGDGKPAQDVFVALESNQIKSSIGNKGTFDPDNPNILMQDENRASITFQRANGAIIRMKDSRDFSSFAHEGAHLYLEIMADLAELPDASERLVNDYAKALKYLGVANRFEVTGEHHELWARSWEAYLWEGKSPTAELAPLFSVYSGWMRTVYQKITNLLQPGEELNDEIRGVFDRMMATDEQIKNSEDFMGYVALYSSAEEMGVSDRAFQLYREHMDQAHNESVDHETQKMLRSMLWAKKKWWKDELAKIEDEVRAEAEAEPVYKALHFLQRGKNPDGTESDLTPFKLSKESLLELLQNSQATLNKLPGRGKYGIYSAKGGVHVDVAANILGYDSGAKLIDALMNAPHMEEFIRDEAKNRMTALHPDPLTDPELMDEITQAVHNEKRGKILAAELKALRKQEKEHAKAVKAALKDKDENEKKAIATNAAQIPKRVDYAHIKAAAKEVIEGLRYRDITPNTYLQAERRAGRLAFEAMKKKDYETAYAQKRTQIMQYEAYRAAIRAKAKMESNQKYLRGMEKTAKRKRMGKGGVLEQIDAILEGINFKRIPNKRLDQTPVLRELLPALRKQVEEGTMVIPEEVLKSMETPDGVNWREMTVKEFQGITDIVRQLESQADHTVKMLVNGEYVIIKDAAAKLAASIESNNAVVEPVAGATKTLAERSGEALDSIGSALANIGHIAKLLDGMDDFGTFNRMIVIPMRRAVSEKLMPWQAKATSDIKRLYMKHYDRWEMQLFGIKNYAKMGDRNISKGEALSIALNQGSATNKAAFFGGKKINGKPAYSPEDTEAVLALLDERDWNFVQAMWDYRQSYWSQLQETQKQRRGISSEQVEPEPFTITSSDGVEMNMRGGYYHLNYDPTQSKKKKEKNHDDYFSGVSAGKHVSGSTRAGATYNRVDKHGEVVQLGLHVFENEIREIIRDMAIGSEVNYVDAMLKDDEVRKQFKLTGNGHHLKTLDVWIQDVAVGELPAGHTLDKIVAMARTNFTMSKLMLNFRVGLLQFAGAAQTAAIVGKRATAKGALRYASNPAAATRLAFGKSANLAARYGKDSRAFDMAVSDASERLSHGHGGLPTYTKLVAEVYQTVGFAPIYMAQGVTDVITWISAYEKGLSKKNLSDPDAIVYADAQVQIAQTSGLWMDRSAFERGSTSENSRQNRYMRLWATLISFMVSRTVNVYLETKIAKKDVNLSSIVNYVANISLLLVVDAILVSMLYQKFDDDDEPEDILLQVAKESGLGLIGGIPGIRDIESAKYGSGNTAIGSAANSISHIAIQTSKGDFNKDFWKSSIDLFGILTGAPSGAINRTVDVAMSDDPEALEFLFGKDKKK